MHFDLGSHMRSRSRSAQLEKTLTSVAGMGSMSFTDHKRSLRTLAAPWSAGPLLENTNISNVGGGLQGTAGLGPRASEPMVHFDKEPPKLLPAIPMTYGELYAKSESRCEDDVENANEPEVEKADENTEDQDDEDDENENEDEIPEPLVLTC